MDQTQNDIHILIEKQKKYFKTGETLSVDFRIKQLKRLKDAIQNNTKKIEAALNKDLDRSSEEAFLTDIGPSIMEINEMIAGTRKWSKHEIHFSGLLCFPSLITRVYKMPYGVSLIMSPYNFPFLLSLGPLAAAISGGNTAIIKASSKSSNCTKILKEIISNTFPSEYISVVDGGHDVVDGGHDVADACLSEKFDKIFYTGSPEIGRHVMKKAAENLIPIALELGGETGNWCIIRKDADIKDAARKIVFFKLCNSGQICININQIAVAEEISNEFLKHLKNEFVRQIGKNPLKNPEYTKLITSESYEKCLKEAEKYKERIIFGGEGCPETQKYAPTIIYPVHPDEEICNHELFNPLLPVIPFHDKNIDEIIDIISEREHGLALYLFTKDKKWANKIMSTQQYGGGCINEVCIHLMVKGVPFNGTGHSGIGAYHGVWGFREFTHPSTVLYGSNKFNLPLREHPYSGKGNNYKYKLMKFFER